MFPRAPIRVPRRPRRSLVAMAVALTIAACGGQVPFRSDDQVAAATSPPSAIASTPPPASVAVATPAPSDGASASPRASVAAATARPQPTGGLLAPATAAPDQAPDATPESTEGATPGPTKPTTEPTTEQTTEPTHRTTPPPPPAPTATPQPTARPTPHPTPTPRPSSLPTPNPTSPPTPDPTPAPLTGQTKIVEIAPTQFTEARVRGNAHIETLPDGSIQAVSTRESNADLYVEWLLEDDQVLPPGASAATVVTIVCGNGSGDWWEVYGPYGSDEFEYEITPPGPDGCWHFHERGRHTDFRVEIWLSGNARMTISHIEFQVTFA